MFLWVLGPALQVWIAVVMWKRKLHREFPVFFWYTLFHISQFLVTFSVQKMPKTLFVAFWTYELLDVFFTLAVVQEVFVHVFNPYQSIRRLGAQVFRWATMVLIGICILAAAAVPGTAMKLDMLLRWLTIMERSANMVEAGLLFLLFILGAVFALDWRDYVWGIAAGMGLSTSIVLVAWALRIYLGTWGPVYAIIYSGGYNVGVIVWFITMVGPERQRRVEGLPDVEQLRSWNRALSGFLR